MRGDRRNSRIAPSLSFSAPALHTTPKRMPVARYIHAATEWCLSSRRCAAACADCIRANKTWLRELHVRRNRAVRLLLAQRAKRN